jgi:hypothetical protein
MGFIAIDAILNNHINQKYILDKAVKYYENFLDEAHKCISDIEINKSHKVPIKARTIWELGNAIFRLTNKLDELGLKLDRIYEHLSRDLGKNHKWFEKVIIFRRYVKKSDVISQSLNWKDFKKSTKKKAILLSIKKS